MPNTNYKLNGKFGAWASGNFIIYEEQTSDGPLQTFEVRPSLFSTYNPDPSVLEHLCQPGTHVCYYGTYSTQMEGRKIEVECRIAPPVNGYSGEKMLSDLLAHRRTILAGNPHIETIHLDYVSPHLIHGKVPPSVISPYPIKFGSYSR